MHQHKPGAEGRAEKSQGARRPEEDCNPVRFPRLGPVCGARPAPSVEQSENILFCATNLKAQSEFVCFNKVCFCL